MVPIVIWRDESKIIKQKNEKIATLGPAGTFSERAAKQFITCQQGIHEILFFPSIHHVLNAIGETCEIGVLPIENFSEGFIALVLDELVERDFIIIDEILLPINFSFICNANKLSEIKELFVQFVAKGQCYEFIKSLGNIKISTTESNIESMHKVMSGENSCSAIVPSDAIEKTEFNIIINNINDYKNNQTRFLVLTSKNNPKMSLSVNKTSIIVLDDDDHPGLLSEVLHSFSKRKINLISIISRPTRKEFGKYHFFIDFEGHTEDINVTEALNEINRSNKVKLLGSYTISINV